MTTPSDARTPRDTPPPYESRTRRGLFSLIVDVPRLIVDLLQAEIESFKAELSAKLKAAGIGAGLLVGAGVIAFFAALVFTAAAVLALALVLPAWAAALIVGGILLLLAALIGVIGYQQLKRGVPPTPSDTIDSVKDDVRVIRGLRKRGTS